MKTGEKIIAATAAIVIFVVIAGFALSTASQGAYFDDASPVMYFYSAQCHFCLQQKPILEELATKGYRVKSMDVGVYPDYWKKYGIEGTPTFLAANGETKVGLTQKEDLEPWLQSHGAKIK